MNSGRESVCLEKLKRSSAVSLRLSVVGLTEANYRTERVWMACRSSLRPTTCSACIVRERHEIVILREHLQSVRRLVQVEYG